MLTRHEKEIIYSIFHAGYKCSYCMACDLSHLKFGNYPECTPENCVFFQTHQAMTEIGMSYEP